MIYLQAPKIISALLSRHRRHERARDEGVVQFHDDIIIRPLLVTIGS
jgi:hypothetical protein